MNATPSLSRLALAALAVAALGLAGCDRGGGDRTSAANDHAAATPSPTTPSGNTTAVAGNDTPPAPSPGMSGSPGAGGRDPASADLNALPPTAAGSAAAGGDAGEPLAAGDRRFVTEAAAGGMFEVQAGKLAADKATDPAVKQYAQMLVTDHGNANDQLKALAGGHDVTLPADLPSHLKSQLDKLQKAQGKDFDREYAKIGVKDHKEDIAKFEKASKDVKNADLKAWIDKTLPTLKEHLAAAQKLPENGGKG